MRASVIVPCYNSSATISRCLSSLVSQETDFEHEIVVFDSSNDGTDEIVARDFPQVKLTHHDERTMAGDARNIAVSNSTGEVLCFTDSDCIVSEGWLQAMVDEVSGGEARVVQGGVRPANPKAWMGLATCLMEFRFCYHLMPAGDLSTIVTCNVAMTRDVFERCGPFPSDMWPGEDTVVAERLRVSGERVKFCPQHTIAHINRTTWGAQFRHQRTLGRAIANARSVVPSLPAGKVMDHPWLMYLLIPVTRPLRTAQTLGAVAPNSLLTTIPLLPLMWLTCFPWVYGYATFRPDAEAAAPSGPRS